MERIFRIFRNFQFSRNFHPLVGTFQGRKIMFRQPRDNHRSLEGDIKIRFLFDLLTFHGIHSHGSRGFLPVLYIYIYTRALHSSAGSSKFRRPCQVESESILPLPPLCPVKKSISSTYARYTFIIPSKYTRFRYEGRVHLGLIHGVS